MNYPNNYTSTTLMSLPAKLLARITETRIKEQIGDSLEEKKYSFRKSRST